MNAIVWPETQFPPNFLPCTAPLIPALPNACIAHNPVCLTVSTYNGMLTSILDVERPLVQPRLEIIQGQLEEGLVQLNWNDHQKIDRFITDATFSVDNLHSIMTACKNNVKVWCPHCCYNAERLQRAMV